MRLKDVVKMLRTVNQELEPSSILITKDVLKITVPVESGEEMELSIQNPDNPF